MCGRYDNLIARDAYRGLFKAGRLPKSNFPPRYNAQAAAISRGIAKRRSLIPATGFYEWQQRADGKQPYRFRRKDLEPFAFAGIWEFARIGGEEILSACMIVGQPNPLVSGVHDRMPVMLLADDYDRWLDPGARPVNSSRC